MFDEVFKTNKKVLIPFIMAGVPTLQESYHLAVSMIEEGAKILELGVPFSDPSADGVTLQRAAELAIENHVTILDVLSLAKKIHDAHPNVPIVLFTYLNPLLSLGLDEYVERALQCGISATLTVDLPLEEAHDYISIHKKRGLKTVFLASPTTTKERLLEIDQASTGFLYYVSRSGVTGERSSVSSSLENEIEMVREIITSPMVIGFGISNAQQAKEISLKADAVVIGSAYMRLILEGKTAQEREHLVRKLTRECVKAIE